MHGTFCPRENQDNRCQALGEVGRGSRVQSPEHSQATRAEAGSGVGVGWGTGGCGPIFWDGRPYPCLLVADGIAHRETSWGHPCLVVEAHILKGFEIRGELAMHLAVTPDGDGVKSKSMLDRFVERGPDDRLQPRSRETGHNPFPESEPSGGSNRAIEVNLDFVRIELRLIQRLGIDRAPPFHDVQVVLDIRIGGSSREHFSVPRLGLNALIAIEIEEHGQAVRSFTLERFPECVHRERFVGQLR